MFFDSAHNPVQALGTLSSPGPLDSSAWTVPLGSCGSEPHLVLSRPGFGLSRSHLGPRHHSSCFRRSLVRICCSPEWLVSGLQRSLSQIGHRPVIQAPWLFADESRGDLLGSGSQRHCLISSWPESQEPWVAVLQALLQLSSRQRPHGLLGSPPAR